MPKACEWWKGKKQKGREPTREAKCGFNEDFECLERDAGLQREKAGLGYSQTQGKRPKRLRNHRLLKKCPNKTG